MPSIISDGIPCSLSGETDWKETARKLHKIATFYFDSVFDSSLSDTKSFNDYAKYLDEIEDLF